MLPKPARGWRSGQISVLAPFTLRHAVLWRKTSRGIQTEEGERFVERILSIRETCRLQDRRLHHYLIDVHTARLTGQAIPTPLAA